MTLRSDLRITQGETWQAVVSVQSGTALNLPDCTVRGQIRSGFTSGSALHTWSVEEGNVEFGDKQVVLHVPATVSADWSWTSGVFDLELTDPSGNTTRLLEGAVWVNPNVTR